MFGAGFEQAERYAHLLATVGVERGLIGPREAPRLWERHLLNCAVVEEVLPRDAVVCDVGSGAGLPGLVLAICRPDLRVTVLDPLLRRTTFLQQAVADLGLTHCTVVRGRANELHGTVRFDVVTARALAPLARLLDWCMPLVAPGGSLVALKGASVHAEVEAAGPELVRHRTAAAEVLQLGASKIQPPTTVLRVDAAGVRR